MKAEGTEAEVASTVKQVEEPIRKLGGRIEQSVSWGRRRLAYRIGHQVEGTYQLVQFQLPPAQLDELKRLLRLNESLVRFLVLKREQSNGQLESRVSDR
jgi:small subunit ribosomal protein S6